MLIEKISNNIIVDGVLVFYSDDRDVVVYVYKALCEGIPWENLVEGLRSNPENYVKVPFNN